MRLSEKYVPTTLDQIVGQPAVVRRLKTITMPRGYNKLHIELPGCIVNIQVGLQNNAWEEVVYISVDAHGDRFAGEPEWWADGGKVEYKGGACRIIREVPG